MDGSQEFVIKFETKDGKLIVARAINRSQLYRKMSELGFSIGDVKQLLKD